MSIAAAAIGLACTAIILALLIYADELSDGNIGSE